MLNHDLYLQRLQRREKIASVIGTVGKGVLLGVLPFSFELCALMAHPELLNFFGPNAGTDGGFLLKTVLVDVGIGEAIIGGAAGLRVLKRRSRNRSL